MKKIKTKTFFKSQLSKSELNKGVKKNTPTLFLKNINNRLIDFKF